MNSLPAITGWHWLKQGAGLFRKQPAALATLLFANILISLGVSALPFVGPLVVSLLIPSFSLAFMQACLMIENGQRVTPAVLLTGFRKPIFPTLCKIGLVYLGISLVQLVLVYLLIDQEAMQEMARQSRAGEQPQVSGAFMLTVILIALLNLVGVITMCFAGPLTYWQKMPPGKATFYSFFAVLRSARVFLVMLLAWFAMFVAITMVLAMLLGGSSFTRVLIMWLIFLFVLLLQCALYAGYRQIFGKPVDGAQTGPVNLSK
ncbi:hypothetical protein LQ564_17955 [Massilia sp. G4R7]|uniref:Uncharacterized protein n=1 Tax=Massilia phyllostachyos TaxID=2898585 RepID=A0ABS8QAX6_9BURK|nr:BPSS1780 family membrane protein [Massilia phyllostachyos]MCD2518197.1 hypothetical protein [Massilia phyllostachyos]